MKKLLDISNLIWSLFLILGFNLLFTNCAKNELGYMDINAEKSTLQLSILSNIEVNTRALSAEQIAEQYVNSGYVFVFNEAGTTQKSNYTLQSSDILNNGESTQSVTALFSLKIVNGDKVVVVLNTALAQGVDLNDVTIANMDVSFPLGGHEGFESVADGTTGGLPMYGVYTWDANSVTKKVIVERSVAKVQVMINPKVSGIHSSGFTTGNVTYQLYNYAINGKITPNAGGVNDSDLNKSPIAEYIYDIEITRATSSTSDNFTGASYIYEYKYSTKIIGEQSSTTQDVNTPSENRLAVILKNSATRKYYRLDLCSNSVGSEYIDVLRNHHYKIIINSVNSSGSASAEDALHSAADNIEYEIVDDTGNTTISNGRYAISVGEEPLAGKRLAGWNTITNEVATNVRFITHDGGHLPPGVSSDITVVDELGEPITGASIVPRTLTGSVNTLSLTLPTTITLPSIRFKIVLGSLEFLSEKFSFVHTTVFDCHEYGENTQFLPYDLADVTWVGDSESAFVIVADETTSFTVAPRTENVTPTSWKTWNNTTKTYDASTEEDIFAIPVFEDKVINGTLSDGTPIAIRQLSPIYIGRYGSPIDGSFAGNYVQLTADIGQPLRKRAIIEAREDEDGTTPLGWGADTSFADNIVNNGLKITKDFGSTPTNYALNKCYKKNATSVEIKWYLPAREQLSGAWVALTEVGYSGNQTFVSSNYWSATELQYTRWYVSFIDGDTHYNAFEDPNRVRCIRDL